MEESSRAAKKACVRRVPRARAKQRPVHVLLFIVFEGWQLRVGERREIEQGIARMHEQLELTTHSTISLSQIWPLGTEAGATR